MKCGDLVIVVINNKPLQCQVYGEIYEPKYWNAFSPGPSHLSAIEIYKDKQVYEIAVSKVLAVDELSEKQLEIVRGGMDTATFENWKYGEINEGR